jgi:hypothetical protein
MFEYEGQFCETWDLAAKQVTSTEKGPEQLPELGL